MSRAFMIPANHTQGESYLRQAFGESARFRAGQWEAIEHVLSPGSRLLLFQPPGWGKSAVYLVAAAFHREAGRGPTLVVSPLVALMRNQVAMAAKMGLRAVSLDASYEGSLTDLAHDVEAGAIDLIYLAPERLASRNFQREFWPILVEQLALLVIDEAHCISEWAQSFRPDYLRLLPMMQELPESSGVLACTASGTPRVVADLEGVLGPRHGTIRGLRQAPRIQQNAFEFASHTERLAFLGQSLAKLPKPGIVFALTIAGVEQIAAYLRHLGFRAEAYHADLDSDRRIELERALDGNELDVLVATTALGMGYDKQDLHFVVHAQPPLSMLAYDQQLGRAGRDGSQAFGAVLWTNEDVAIGDLMVERDAISESLVQKILAKSVRGVQWKELRTLAPMAELEIALSYLQAIEALEHFEDGYRLQERGKPVDLALTKEHHEYKAARWLEVQLFLVTSECRVQAMFRALGEHAIGRCGQCDNCKPRKRMDIRPESVQAAEAFLGRQIYSIEPRRRLPRIEGGPTETVLGPEIAAEPGIALTSYADFDLGRRIRAAKYSGESVPNELISRAVLALETVGFRPNLVTWIPSERHPLIPAWAQSLAAEMGVPARATLERVASRPPQKLMIASARQFANVWGAWRSTERLEGNVLLVDDIVDSGWTFTVASMLLRQAGASAVLPLAWAVGSRGRHRLLHDG